MDVVLIDLQLVNTGGPIRARRWRIQYKLSRLPHLDDIYLLAESCYMPMDSFHFRGLAYRLD